MTNRSLDTKISTFQQILYKYNVILYINDVKKSNKINNLIEMFKLGEKKTYKNGLIGGFKWSKKNIHYRKYALEYDLYFSSN